jgi:hypothetical protein
VYKFCSKQFHLIKYLLSNVGNALRNTRNCYWWQILIETGSHQQIFVNPITLDFLEMNFLYVDTYTAKLIAKKQKIFNAQHTTTVNQTVSNIIKKNQKDFYAVIWQLTEW